MTLSNAYEKSAYGVVVAFVDENGAPVTPTSATWTLTDGQGQVVNSRSAVSISPLSTSVTIPLTGNDMVLTGYFGTERVLTVNALYNSAIFGNNTSFYREVHFNITPLLNVS